jgi:hypothetical protein
MVWRPPWGYAYLRVPTRGVSSVKQLGRGSMCGGADSTRAIVLSRRTNTCLRERLPGSSAQVVSYVSDRHDWMALRWTCHEYVAGGHIVKRGLCAAEESSMYSSRYRRITPQHLTGKEIATRSRPAGAPTDLQFYTAERNRTPCGYVRKPSLTRKPAPTRRPADWQSLAFWL